jgi:hypothetical protein
VIQESIEKCLPHKDPLERPDYTEAEAQALRACHRGEGSARQQRMALDFLMRSSGTHDTSYRPGEPYDTAFAEGKRFIGTTIVWMLFAAPTKTDPDKIAIRQVDENDRSDNR